MEKMEKIGMEKIRLKRRKKREEERQVHQQRKRRKAWKASAEVKCFRKPLAKITTQCSFATDLQNAAKISFWQQRELMKVIWPLTKVPLVEGARDFDYK